MHDIDVHKRSFGHPDHELIHALEPDQMVAAASRPLPRYALSKRANLALWGVRVFVLSITLMVIYTFVVSLQ